MKYKTLTELKKAIDQGEIQVHQQDGDCLMIDADSTYFYLGDEVVFRMHPFDLLEEALNLLGIPWENA